MGIPLKIRVIKNVKILSVETLKKENNPLKKQTPIYCLQMKKKAFEAKHFKNSISKSQAKVTKVPCIFHILFSEVHLRVDTFVKIYQQQVNV